MKGIGEGVCHKGSLKKVTSVFDAGLLRHALEFGMPATKRDVSSTPGTRGIGGFRRALGN